MAHGKPRLRRMRPKCVEQRFALSEIEAEDICVRSPTQEECLPACVGIGADQRMMCTDGLANVGDLLVAFAQMACAIARSVMHRDLTLASFFRCPGRVS